MHVPVQTGVIYTAFGLVLAFGVTTLQIRDEPSTECQPTDKVCEFWLVVDQRLTMMHGKDLVFPSKGKLYRYDVTNTSSATPIPADDVITGDGSSDPRLVVVANGTMPGPSISVYEGQTVILHVQNNLLSDGVTIHIHGLPQKGTPWMDGVAYVTQCPVNPGQSFTYRFLAAPKGTYWWHSHIGSQRTMGLFGAFIIRENTGSFSETYDEDFVLSLQDWNSKREADFGYQQMKTDIFIGRQRYNTTSSLDGGKFSKFYMTSGLINGRGRYYDSATGKHNGAPLEMFHVTSGKTYRFRVIGVGELYPFRVSVDGHMLEVIACDGSRIEPVVVESFIINPGERFDFILTANKTISNYWIRAETLEVEYRHVAEAILHYEGTDVDEEPTGLSRPCSPTTRCVVLNCPFKYYPENEDSDCMFIDQLRALDEVPVPPVTPGKFKEVFLNFAMPHMMASVNGRAFKFPPVSALTQPMEVQTTCDKAGCGDEKICRCTNSFSIEQGDTVQFVLTNMGIGKGLVHPIHTHGHSFHVLKMGLGQYDKSSGRFTSSNKDIDCRGSGEETICNNPTWSNSSWLGGNVPGTKSHKAPRKDTIIVPSGGYVVLRIAGDNPGLWFMHCHIEMHTLDGMALVLNESFSEIPPPPPGFPKCGNFRFIQYTPATSEVTEEITSANEPSGHYSAAVFWGTTSCLVSLLIVQFVVILIIHFQPFKHWNRLHGYEMVEE